MREHSGNELMRPEVKWHVFSAVKVLGQIAFWIDFGWRLGHSLKSIVVTNKQVTNNTNATSGKLSLKPRLKGLHSFVYKNTITTQSFAYVPFTWIFKNVISILWHDYTAIRFHKGITLSVSHTVLWFHTIFVQSSVIDFLHLTSCKKRHYWHGSCVLIPWLYHNMRQ